MLSSPLRALFTAVVLNVAAMGPALAQASGCTGRDLLATMKQTDSAAYQAIRTAADATDNARTVLWRIENSAQPHRAASYLFGTIHVTDERVQTFSPAVLDAFSSVRNVGIEVADVSVERLGEGLNTMNGAGRLLLTGKDKLDSVLAPAEVSVSLKALERSGLPPDIAARTQPWAAFALLATADCERSRMIAGKLPFDSEIARRAEDRGMGTFDLETVESQFAMLADVPMPHQVALLKSRVALGAQHADLVETMVQLYLARDIGAMWPLQVAVAKAAGVDPAAYEAYREHVLVERTKRIANRLASHLTRGGVFIAVGAMHLPGPQGLVASIKGMGYQVSAIE